MTTQTIQIEALDTLFFKDGKPFSMGEETWADGLFPPSPSVIYGALRTTYFAENINNFEFANTQNDPTIELKIKNIYFKQAENNYWFPIPLDLVKDKDIDEKVCFSNSENILNDQQKIISNYPLKNLSLFTKNVENINGFINNYELNEYIKNTKNDFPFEELEYFITTEPKIGIKRNNKTLITEEGNLYRIGQLRLQKTIADIPLKIMVEFTFGKNKITSKNIKLGGETKTATIKNETQLKFALPNKIDKHFKLLFLTPAIFKNGWLPNQFNENFEIELNGIKLKLLKAFVGKPINIGGFDMKSNKGKSGYPKPMYKAIPAGSVYYFEILDNSSHEKIIEKFHTQNISDVYAEQGFGHTIVCNLNFLNMEIITTVGTSLLTNYFDKDKNKNLNLTYKSLYETKLKGKTYSDEEWNNLLNDNYLINFKNELLNNWIKQDQSCAEIKTLKKIKEKKADENLIYLYHFITTNTLDGYFVADILCEHFNIEKHTYLHRIEGLQVTNPKVFKEKGINKLIKKIKEIKDNAKGEEVILNISGGYKAIIPLLTIIGQLENIPLNYIYEDSDELIEIGKLPINFDWDIIEQYITYIKNENLLKKAKENILDDLYKLDLIEYDKNIPKLTLLGSLLAKYLDKESPFLQTIFGYLVEYKLEECLAKKYGRDKVEKGYIPKKDVGDIDLMILQENNKYIYIEIKSFEYYVNNTDLMKKIADNYIKRCNEAKNSRQIEPNEIWLLTYSYAITNQEVLVLTEEQKENLNYIKNKLKTVDFLKNSNFKLKHFYIKRNKIDSSNRHNYQEFMSSSIKFDQIKQIDF